MGMSGHCGAGSGSGSWSDRAGSGSQCLSYHPSQVQLWGNADNPNFEHLPGAEARPGHEPESAPGLVGPMAGQRFGEWGNDPAAAFLGQGSVVMGT